jgi:hypothetical protein
MDNIYSPPESVALRVLNNMQVFMKILKNYSKVKYLKVNKGSSFQIVITIHVNYKK